MKKLLWIDDNEALINTCTPLFRRYGFVVIKATTVSDALTAIREEKLDGVLLDVRLKGGENGIKVLQEVRARNPNIKIAIFTGYPDAYDQILSNEFGASLYITKVNKTIPLDPEKQRKFFIALNQIFPGGRSIITWNRNKSFALVTLILDVLIALIGNIATNYLPDTIKPYLCWSWPLLGVLILVSIYLFLRRNE